MPPTVKKAPVKSPRAKQPYAYPTSSSSCKACPLHDAGCLTVGMSGHRTGHSADPPLNQTRALLIIGEAPGYHEDKAGRPFVGPSGKILRRVYIEANDLHERADIYLTNAVRCRPPKNTTPTKSQLKACRHWLLAEIAELRFSYGDAILLCVGASACRSVLGTSLTEAMRHQGQRFVPGPDAEGDMPVFATYHPAYLLSKRNPTAVHYVKDHLKLLTDYLDGTFEPSAPTPQHQYTRGGLPDGTTRFGLKIFRESADEEGHRFLEHGPKGEVPGIVGPPSGFSPSLPAREFFYTVSPPVPTHVALDIETYGALQGPAGGSASEQTVFHPVKSVAIDGIPRDQLIASVSLTWMGGKGGKPLSGIFVWPDDQAKLVGFFRWLCKHPETALVGQNVLFDLMYLRYCSPSIRWLLDQFKITLCDLAITSYLESEARPERSLKNLSPLLGGSTYSGSCAGRFKDRYDPDLHNYNVQDTTNTLKLQMTLEKRLADDGRPLTDATRTWYSQLLYTVLHMSEAGTCMDPDKLSVVEERCRTRMEKLERAFEGRTDSPLSGKGSETAIQKVVDGAAEPLDSRHQAELAITKVRQTISTSKHNVQKLLHHHSKIPTPVLEDGTRVRLPWFSELRAIIHFRRHQKILTSYIKPLAQQLVEDVAYPSWYVVPAAIKDHDDLGGGTKQCRLSAKRPAIQTFPPPLKACITSRFRPGAIIHVDYSQLELRVAALLSQDEVMWSAYEQGLDLHAMTASTVFGMRLQYVSREQRAGGKTVNFATIYRVGGPGLHTTLEDRNRGHSPLTEDECYAALRDYWREHQGLWDWQESLIRTAKRDGRLTLPLLGQTVHFGGSAAAIDATYIPEICNFPVQATAALIMLSTQYVLTRAIRERRMRSLICINEHDGLYIDSPAEEIPTMVTLLKSILPSPPYYDDLCEHLGRRLPLEYSLEVLRYA